MFILSVFSALLVFCPVVRVSVVPPSFSSLLPTFLVPISPHLSLLCLIVPSPLFVYSNLPSLPFCTTLSFVSSVPFHALFFMFDDYHLDYWPDCLRLLDWICFLDWTVYQYILWGKMIILSNVVVCIGVEPYWLWRWCQPALRWESHPLQGH